MTRWRPGRPTAAVTGAIAIILAVIVGATIAAAPGRLDALVATLAWIGVSTVAVGVAAAWASAGPVAALALGAGYAATRFGQPRAVEPRVIAVAIALFLIAELTAWAAEARTGGIALAFVRPRVAILAGTSVLSAIAVAVVASVVTLPIPDDLAVAALGVAALVAVPALVLNLARR